MESGGEASNLATWLDAAGYQTGLIGKYLNGYESAPADHIPPGWDHWLAFKHPGYFEYDLVRTDGSTEHRGSADADYSTDVIADGADAFIRKTDPAVPLFAYITPNAVHGPHTPAPRDGGSCATIRDYRPPSFNVLPRNAPRWLRYPALTKAQVTTIDLRRRRACEALGAIDDLIRKVNGALVDTGRLSNTLIIFASDNGFLWGEHRAVGEWHAYNAATRIPMVVRMDGVLPAGEIDERLALNVDIASTIEDVTGSVLPRPCWAVSARRLDKIGFRARSDQRRRHDVESTGLLWLASEGSRLHPLRRRGRGVLQPRYRSIRNEQQDRHSGSATKDQEDASSGERCM